ncbi:MAG: glycosyltransferase family 2 protein [Zoogloeaceae bacterium]|nr:glycosyltransferase family 2 protein [Zoogloeaceae bacterium]
MTTPSLRLVAVIPVYDHGETVAAVITALRAVWAELPVILVDDGSHATCAATLRERAATDNGIQLITHPENRGKGAAVLTGLAAAAERGFSHALQIDADGQHDPEALPRFFAAMRAHPQAAIIGYPRYAHDVPKGRLYGRYLTHIWVWINTLSLRIRDSMCGLRIYPLAAVIPLFASLARATRMDFDPEILVRLDWAGTPIENLPVAVRYPEGGRSHFRLWKDNARIARMHARLFFGMLRRLPRLLFRLCGRPQ